MPRRAGIPSYRNKSGRAVVTLPDSTGQRTTHFLGAYGSPESREAYARVIAEWQARDKRPSGRDLSVAEVILLFSEHAKLHYRHPDGRQTGEAENFRYALRPVRELYGLTQANAFGPMALKVVRKAMIEAGLCRSEVNRRVSRVKTVFKWAVSEELVEPSVYHGLLAVKGLEAGRTEAPEAEKVLPVCDEHVEAVLKIASPVLSAMIQVQRLTGNQRPRRLLAASRTRLPL